MSEPINIVLDRDDPKLLGRGEELLLDPTWWAKLSGLKQPALIHITQNPNGTFASVALELASRNAVADFEYKLSEV
jgi:hypothetical protein